LWTPKKRRAEYLKKETNHISARKSGTRTRLKTKLEQPRAKLDQERQDMKLFLTRNRMNITRQCEFGYGFFLVQDIHPEKPACLSMQQQSTVVVVSQQSQTIIKY